MAYSILNTLKDLAIFMVICEAIVQFAPSSKYMKYCKPIIALMILGKLLSSFTFFSLTDISKELETGLALYEQRLLDYEESYEEIGGMEDFVIKEAIESVEMEESIIENATDDIRIKEIINIEEITEIKVETSYEIP